MLCDAPTSRSFVFNNQACQTTEGMNDAIMDNLQNSIHLPAQSLHPISISPSTHHKLIQTPTNAHFDLFFARWHYALLAHSVLLSVLQLQTFFGYTAGVHIHSAITLSQVCLSLVFQQQPVRHLNTVCFYFKPRILTCCSEPHSLTKVVAVLLVRLLLSPVRPKRTLRNRIPSRFTMSLRPAYKVEELLALRGSAAESTVSLDKFPDEEAIKGMSISHFTSLHFATHSIKLVINKHEPPLSILFLFAWLLVSSLVHNAFYLSAQL